MDDFRLDRKVIIEKSFSLQKNGYNIDEVNNSLRELADQIDYLLKRKHELLCYYSRYSEKRTSRLQDHFTIQSSSYKFSRSQTGYNMTEVDCFINLILKQRNQLGKDNYITQRLIDIKKNKSKESQEKALLDKPRRQSSKKSSLGEFFAVLFATSLLCGIIIIAASFSDGIKKRNYMSYNTTRTVLDSSPSKQNDTTTRIYSSGSEIYGDTFLKTSYSKIDGTSYTIRMSKCPKCGSIQAMRSICFDCGYKMALPKSGEKTCPYCGWKSPGKYNTCRHCNKDISKVEITYK